MNWRILEAWVTRSHAIIWRADKKVRSRNTIAGKERKDGLKSIQEDR